MPEVSRVSDTVLAIRARVALLLIQHGYSVKARELICLTLMREYGINSVSALMYIRYSRKRIGRSNSNRV